MSGSGQKSLFQVRADSECLVDMALLTGWCVSALVVAEARAMFLTCHDPVLVLRCRSK